MKDPVKVFIAGEGPAELGRWGKTFVATDEEGFIEACLRRVRALEQSGVIQGYTALVAEPQDDRIVVITRITLERQSEELMQKFEAAVRLHPEIEECFLMTGDADYVLRTSAASAAGYEQIHKEILSRLPGVSRINSSIALRDVLRASRTKRSSPARRG